MKLLGKLTYANVIATVALFVALGGASYAATNLPKNSVGTNQIKELSINASKLKGAAVTAPKIAKEAVTGAKVKLSTLGTVPSAQKASLAEQATSAENAQKLGGSTASQLTSQAVTQATKASTLACPSGTTASTGVCFGPKHPAANWYEAIEACAKEGMTLPSPAQLYAYGRAHIPSNEGFEWTGNALSSTTALKIQASVSAYGAGEAHVFGDSLPFHCFGYPTN